MSSFHFREMIYVFTRLTLTDIYIYIHTSIRIHAHRWDSLSRRDTSKATSPAMDQLKTGVALQILPRASCASSSNFHRKLKNAFEQLHQDRRGQRGGILLYQCEEDKTHKTRSTGRSILLFPYQWLFRCVRSYTTSVRVSYHIIAGIIYRSMIFFSNDVPMDIPINWLVSSP